MKWSERNTKIGKELDAVEHFDCSCASMDHVFRFHYNHWDCNEKVSGWPPELNIATAFKANPSIWKRLRVALAYLFAREEPRSTWAYDGAVITDIEELGRMISFLERVRSDWSGDQRIITTYFGLQEKKED